MSVQFDCYAIYMVF